MENLTDDQIAEFREAFSIFDKDGDGCIGTKEVGTVLRSLGQSPTEEQIEEMVRKIDENGDGTIDFDEFITLLTKFMNETDEEEELCDLFNVFDKNGSGSISLVELKLMVRDQKEKITEKDLEEIMKYADKNGDGHVDFKEFIRMMVSI